MPRLFQQRAFCGAFATASVQSSTGSRHRDARQTRANESAEHEATGPDEHSSCAATRDVAKKHWQRPTECQGGTDPRQVQRLLRHEIGLGEH